VQVGSERGQISGYASTPAYRGVPMAPTRASAYYTEETVTRYDFVLPEDQQRMVEDVKEAASKYGFDLEVVDLTKENAFHRWIQEHSQKIKTLPALVTGSGEIIEGVKTKEQIEALLSKEGKLAT
jgi:hypothetical protein